MKANEETIRQKLDLIDENMQYLKEKRSQDLKQADFESLHAIKHALFEITEACIDISSHIIASEGYDKPASYSEVFQILSENGLIRKDLGQSLEQMAKFRNFLIHRYGEVETEKLEEVMNEDLKDVREFATYIYDYIEEGSST